jgi:hypothetical protein
MVFLKVIEGDHNISSHDSRGKQAFIQKPRSPKKFDEERRGRQVNLHLPNQPWTTFHNGVVTKKSRLSAKSEPGW